MNIVVVTVVTWEKTQDGCIVAWFFETRSITRTRTVYLVDDMMAHRFRLTCENIFLVCFWYLCMQCSASDQRDSLATLFLNDT